MTPAEKAEFKMRWTREGEYKEALSYEYSSNLDICKRLFKDVNFRAFKNINPDDSHTFIFHREDDFEEFLKEAKALIRHD